MSGQERHYKMKNKNNAVTFELGICDNSLNIYTGFELAINDLSSSSRVSGMFSIAVDELKWVNNGWNVKSLSKGQSKRIQIFESALFNDLESLTLRISVIFY
eukprot:999460_1